MRLHYSTTSPYARIARIALAEKGVRDLGHALTDPWQDAPELLAANPSARVPALRLDSGLPLTESLLIVLWLETQRPQPTLLGSAPDRTISRAGIGMGAIDAAAAIIISRRIDAGFDESPVGLRRRRSVVQALQRLEADPPSLDLAPDEAPHDAAGLDAIVAVVLLDYIRFRFAQAPWVPATPRLDALAARSRERASFAETLPRDMPQVLPPSAG
jgi:glutathione S-transferase